MKKTTSLVLICSFAYFVSYLSRLNYSACIQGLIDDLGLTKTQTSYATMGLFITYGIGQVFSGLLGDRFDPRKILTGGLLMTSVCNLLMPLMPSVGLMTAVWCVNGVAQAMMFPPMSRIMAANMDAEQFKKACSVISMAASAATILIYLMVPAMIRISSWRMAFYIPAGVAAVAAFIWYKGTAGYGSGEPVKRQAAVESTSISFRRALIVCGIIPIILAIIAQGVLRDGLTTWMPSYIADTFNMETTKSILSGMIIPVFSIIFVALSTYLYRFIKSETKTAAVMFATGLVFVSLLAFTKPGYILTVLFFSCTIGAMHGLNVMLISRLPVYFAPYGKVSTLSGALNACSYIGAAISSYGIAALSERIGWEKTVISWVILAAVGTSVCVLATVIWKRYEKKYLSKQS